MFATVTGSEPQVVTSNDFNNLGVPPWYICTTWRLTHMIESRRHNHYLMPHPMVHVSGMIIICLAMLGIILFF